MSIRDTISKIEESLEKIDRMKNPPQKMDKSTRRKVIMKLQARLQEGMLLELTSEEWEKERARLQAVIERVDAARNRKDL